MRVKTSALISILLFSIIYAQNLSITGYVKDAKNGNILVGANVFIVGTSLGTSAREDGQYKINNVKPGTYSVKASYIGYVTTEDSVTITDTDINLDFNLSYTTIEGKEVNVTAQAKGQMDAINRQLNARSIVNIISSDRIQELPDANAAESVARVPGVSIKREGGEGNKVVIRGLSPKYNAITVEGTRLPSTDPDDRSTDLSMISQYVLDGIEVTKAGTPDQDADVLGGTVNFKLKRARPGFHFNFIGLGIHNGLKDTYEDNKLVFDVSNRFWKDRIGILAQIDLEKRNRSSNELGASYVRDASDQDIDSIGSLSLTGLNLYDILRDNNRRNSLIVADVKIPNRGLFSDGSISFTSLNSSINKDITGYWQSYELQNLDMRLHSGTIDNDIKIKTNTLKYKQTFYSNLHLESFYTSSIAQNNSFNYQFSFLDDEAFISNSVGGLGLNNIQKNMTNDTSKIGVNQYQYYVNKSNESEQTYGANLEYDFRISSKLSGKIKFGFKQRRKDRTYDTNNEYAIIDAAAGLSEPRDSLVAEFPEIYYIPGERHKLSYFPFIDYDYDPGNFLNGRYTIGPVADIEFMKEVYNYFKKEWNRFTTGSTIDEYIMHKLHETNTIMYDYEGSEDYSASYAMLDMDIGDKLNIITGARSEKNKTTYQSYQGTASALPHWVFLGDSVWHTRENDFILPALFLRYKPVSWLNIRFASTNTLTRPSYADILPLYNVIASSQEVEYRNPYLEPGQSKNLDFSITFNDKKFGLFSIGRFEKNISDLIYSSGRRFVDSTALYGLPDNLKNYIIRDYKSNNPYVVNLSGWELDYQTRFWYLPGPLSGLVLNANYTVTESEVKYPRTELLIEVDFGPNGITTNKTNIDSFYVDRLIDQPDQIFNLSIGYDYKGFSGRLSVLSKSNVFMRTNFWPALREATDDYTRWDLSVKQKLPVNGLEIFLNISNITEAIDINRYRSGNSLTSEQHYGKTIDLGFRYSF